MGASSLTVLKATRHLPPATHARAKLSPASPGAACKAEVGWKARYTHRGCPYWSLATLASPSSSSCRMPRARGLPSAAYLCVKRASIAGQSERSCQLTRGWPRLAEAGGCPALDLALAGRAGGRIGRSLWAAVFHIAGTRRSGRPRRCRRGRRRVRLPAPTVRR